MPRNEIAGVVALRTGYSFLKLTPGYPGEASTVAFLNRAFGGGLATEAAKWAGPDISPSQLPP